jgi:proteic killer suppression protein
VIASFHDQATEDIYHDNPSKAARTIPQDLWGRARRLLDYLNAARHLGQVNTVPGANLEKLKGQLKDYWSIRINVQYRIVFKYDDRTARASGVRISKHYAK